MKGYRGFLSVLLASAVLLLGACEQKTQASKPQVKSLSVVASADINRYNDASNPVVVRIYQLSARTEFEAAGFWQIFNNDSPDLAGVVLDKRSLAPLYPNETRRIDFDLVPDVIYLGAFAEFADFETQQFRSVVPIDKKQLDKGVTISVSPSGVSIIMQKSGNVK